MQPLPERPDVVIAMIAGQALCATVFVIDVVRDALAGPLALHPRLEIAERWHSATRTVKSQFHPSTARPGWATGASC